MRVLNRNSKKDKKYLIAITSYCGLDYFNTWSHEIRNSENIQLFIIDSGRQTPIHPITDIPIFESSINIGCAGCWNMACNIGFNLYNYDKIIIAQDDSIFNEHMVEQIWNESNDEVLAGAYDRGFTYAMFGITKNFWNTVGLFDENFLYSSYEDNDYIHRTRLFNKTTKCLNYSADLNISIAGKYINDELRQINKSYMTEKWGHFEGTYQHPFNNTELSADKSLLHNNLTEVYGDINKFPSLTEFETLMSDSHVT